MYAAPKGTTLRRMQLVKPFGLSCTVDVLLHFLHRGDSDYDKFW